MRSIKNIFIILMIGTLLSGCSKEPLEAVGQKKPKRPVVLATTTSTHDSGLLDYIIPDFEKQTGYQVKIIAVGTGQALEMGRRGEADVLLVHAPAKEKDFVAKGSGKNRRAVMHNDFVIVGSGDDPAGIGSGQDAVEALQKVAAAEAEWISRSDNSGTHSKEKALFKEAGIAPSDKWVIETGQGMGASLQIASERKAYILTDRGTFLATSNLNLKVMVEGDKRLFNPYHVMEVKGDKVNKEGSLELAAFFLNKKVQQKIGSFTRHGRQLFVPDAL